MRVPSRHQLHHLLTALTHGAIAAVFFFAAWWLRLDFLPEQPYSAGFLVFIPVAVAIAVWLLLGAPGLWPLMRDFRRWWLLLAGLFVAWAWWSPAWALRPGGATSAAFQLTVALLFAVVVTCVLPSPRSIAVALLAGLLIQGVIATAQVLLQRPIGLSALGEFAIREGNRGLSVLLAGDLRLMRPYGLTVHPNIIGGYFAFALVVCIDWLFRSSARRPRWQHIALWACLAIGWWALLITFSRSALGGFVVGLVAFVLAWFHWPAYRPSDRLFVPLVVMLVTLALLYMAVYSPFVLARAGVGDEVTELRSVTDRRIFTEIAFDVIRRFPVTGVGIGNFPWAAATWLQQHPQYALRPDHVHSLPLLVASELGLTGLLMWGALIGWSVWRVWRAAAPLPGFGLWAGSMALLAVGLLDHYPWTIFHFALLTWAGLAAGSGRAAPSRPSAPSAR